MISILKRSFATVAKKSPKASALPTSQLMNSQIKYERILFINELGKSEGLMDLTLALSRTPHTHNLVLVNDSNKENPICRVITNEKLQPKEADVKRKAEVEEKKERREEQDKEDIMRKRHQDITKIMRCKTNISDHDLNIKIKKAIEMLEKGYKVADLSMKAARNLTVQPQGKQKVAVRIIELLKDHAKASSSPSTVKGKFQVSFKPIAPPK